jgi:hypothetical protein
MEDELVAEPDKRFFAIESEGQQMFYIFGQRVGNFGLDRIDTYFFRPHSMSGCELEVAPIQPAYSHDLIDQRAFFIVGTMIETVILMEMLKTKNRMIEIVNLDDILLYLDLSHLRGFLLFYRHYSSTKSLK